MTIVDSLVKTEELVFVAEAKLPDDLHMRELVRILQDLSTLVSISKDVAVATSAGREVDAEIVDRVRYGSDFLLVLSVGGSLAAILGAVSYAYANFQKGMLDRHTRLKSQRDGSSTSAVEKDVILMQARLVELTVGDPVPDEDGQLADPIQRELIADQAKGGGAKLPRALAHLAKWDFSITVQGKDGKD